MFQSRKIVFFGSPNPSVEILKSLNESGHEIVGAITGKDKRRSRGNTLYPTPVKHYCVDNGIEVFEPGNKAEVEEIAKKLVSERNAEVGIVVAYGKILTVDALNAFKYGCINVHYSLLPRWRGAAPVERAILELDEVTGISIMKMDEGLDTGPVYTRDEIKITSRTTSKDLYSEMASVAKYSLNAVLDAIENIDPIEQSGEKSYAEKLDTPDFEINAESTVEEVSAKVRAGSLIKGAFVNSSIGKFRILEVGDISKTSHSVDGLILNRQGELLSKNGTLQIIKVQSENKPALEFSQWVNGIEKSKFDIEIL